MNEYPRKSDGTIDWDKYQKDLIEQRTLTHSNELLPLLEVANKIEWNRFFEHDAAIKEIAKELGSIDKKKFTDLFLSGLHTPYSNMALYCISILRTFPIHELSDELSAQGNCTICDSGVKFHTSDGIEDFYTSCFERYGCSRDIYPMIFVLKIVNNSETPIPTTYDFEIFRQIINTLKTEKCTYREVIKIIKKFEFVKKIEKEIKTNLKNQGKPCGKASIQSEQKIEMILSMLGVSGILHTEKHKGPFYEYRKQTDLPRAGGGRSDGDYPACWWTSEDGIDSDAFDYWFGNYKELR